MLAEEIYSPPELPADALPSVEELEKLQQQEPENLNVLFALGNLYLRSDEPTKAVSCYRQVLTEEPDRAKVRSNLARALWSLGKLDEAVSEFNQAVLAQPDLSLARYQLGCLQLERGEQDAARRCFLKLLDSEEAPAEALLALGSLEDSAGNLEEAEQYFRKALEAAPNNSEAKTMLAKKSFYQGREYFLKSDFYSAFSLWHRALENFGLECGRDEVLAREMNELLKSYKKRGVLRDVRSQFEQGLRNDLKQRSLYYPLISHFLFSLNLFPEFFEREDSLGDQKKRWQEEVEVDAKAPYPRYRLGLVLAHQGQLELAKEQLIVCRDICPPKKQFTFRLESVVEFIDELFEFEAAVRLELGSDAPLNSWVSSGFHTPFEQSAWKKTGAEPEEAALWRDFSFRPDEAKKWRRQGLKPKDAQEWRESGFDEPEQVKQWFRTGFSPEEARSWEKSFSGEIARAIEFRKAGFQEADQAVLWNQHFRIAWEAATWHELGFSVAQAADFLSKGIKDPYQAAQKRAAELEEKSDIEEDNSHN